MGIFAKTSLNSLTGKPLGLLKQLVVADHSRHLMACLVFTIRAAASETQLQTKSFHPWAHTVGRV